MFILTQDKGKIINVDMIKFIFFTHAERRYLGEPSKIYCYLCGEEEGTRIASFAHKEDCENTFKNLLLELREEKTIIAMPEDKNTDYSFSVVNICEPDGPIDSSGTIRKNFYDYDDALEFVDNSLFSGELDIIDYPTLQGSDS